MKTFKQFLLEHSATYLYHRAKSPEKDVLDVNTDAKFKGGQAIFGGGLYTTTDTKSQLTPRMIKNYGEVLFRLEADLSQCFFFDKKTRESLTVNYSPKQKEAVAQIEALVADDSYYNHWNGADENIVYLYNEYPESRDLIRGNFSGMVYTHKDDGNCALIFLPKELPVVVKSYAQSSNATQVNFDWKPVK